MEIAIEPAGMFHCNQRRSYVEGNPELFRSYEMGPPRSTRISVETLDRNGFVGLYGRTKRDQQYLEASRREIAAQVE